MAHLLYNLAMVLIGPDEKHQLLSLTIPEPSAKRLSTAFSSASGQPATAIPRILAQGFMTVDEAAYNEPTAPIALAPGDDQPAGERMFHLTLADAEAVATGEKYFAMDDGDVILIDGQDTDGMLDRYRQIFAMVAKGEVAVTLNDAGDPVLTPLSPEAIAEGAHAVTLDDLKKVPSPLEPSGGIGTLQESGAPGGLISSTTIADGGASTSTDGSAAGEKATFDPTNPARDPALADEAEHKA